MGLAELVIELVLERPCGGAARETTWIGLSLDHSELLCDRGQLRLERHHTAYEIGEGDRVWVRLRRQDDITTA